MVDVKDLVAMAQDMVHINLLELNKFLNKKYKEERKSLSSLCFFIYRII